MITIGNMDRLPESCLDCPFMEVRHLAWTEIACRAQAVRVEDAFGAAYYPRRIEGEIIMGREDTCPLREAGCD